jgi:ABC-type phosphate/phosphonate transport system substrate-binding protein
MSLRSLRSNAFVVLMLLGFASSAPAQQALSLGAPPSLFADLTPAQVKFINSEFPVMVKEFTGMDGKLIPRMTIEDTANKLIVGTDQFSIFQGVEFAWAKAKHPELEPLMTAIYHSPRAQAVLVVKKDSKYKSFADLKGAAIQRLKVGKEHITLFLDKAAGGDPGKFFAKVDTTDNSESGLDAVLLGKVQAMVTDDASLNQYRDVNPGRYNRLAVIEKSSMFPSSCVAYVPKKVPDEVVQKFKNGMLKANESARGRDVMSSFKITAFQPVPAEYPQWLAEIQKEYPENGKSK